MTLYQRTRIEVVYLPALHFGRVVESCQSHTMNLFRKSIQPIRKALKTPESALIDAIYFRTRKKLRGAGQVQMGGGHLWQRRFLPDNTCSVDDGISLLTTTIVLLNESGSELARTGLSQIGADRLWTKIDFWMTKLTDWLIITYFDQTLFTFVAGRNFLTAWYFSSSRLSNTWIPAYSMWW